MKIFAKVLGILFIVIIVITIGAYVYLSTINVNKYKAQIVQIASKALKRDVNLRDIDFSFSIFKGIKLKVNGLEISEDPRFGDKPLIYVDAIATDLNVWALLTQKKIIMSHIELNSPFVRIIRNKQGLTNMEALVSGINAQPASSGASETGTENMRPQETSESKSSSEVIIPDFSVDTISFNKTRFIFIDQSIEPVINIDFEDLFLQATNFSLKQPFPVRLEGKFWSGKKNINLTAKVQIALEEQQVRVDDVKGEINLADLDLDKIVKSIPQIEAAGLEKGLEGRFGFLLSQMILGQKGLLVLSFDGKLENGKVRTKWIAHPLENIDMHVEVTEVDANIRDILLYIASGKITGYVTVNDYLSDKKFTSKFNLEELKLEELIPADTMPIKMAGKLSGIMEAKGDFKSEESLAASLTGSNQFTVADGRLVDFNLLRFVLDKLSFFPNLVNKLEQSMPEQYKKKLEAKDTVFKSIRLESILKNGLLNLKDVHLEEDDFLLQVAGDINIFTQQGNIKPDFYIQPQLSGLLLASEESLNFLLNENKQIHIPLAAYRGPLTKFVTYPDVKDFIREVGPEKAKDELKKVIFKALDLDEEPQPVTQEGEQNQPASGQPASGQDEVRPEKVIIENILDSIFK